MLYICAKLGAVILGPPPFNFSYNVSVTQDRNRAGTRSRNLVKWPQTFVSLCCAVYDQVLPGEYLMLRIS